MKALCRVLSTLFLLVASPTCEDQTRESDAGSDSDTDAQSNTDADTDADSNADTDLDPVNTTRCGPLPDVLGNTVTVTPDRVGELTSIVSSLQEGDTLLFESGTYLLNGVYLWVSTPGVTLRGKTSNPEDVVLDGQYVTTEIVTIAASNVTLAELTIKRAYSHPIHVTSSDQGNTVGTFIYRVHLIDPREQCIKINPHQPGSFSDDGEIACSSMLLTDEGRPRINPAHGGCYTGGVDAHQASGWVIRDNVIEGFWCNTGLSEHAVHCWYGCRGTIVERNVLVDNARGIGFGLYDSGAARTFTDDPCPGTGGTYVGHYTGVIRNNFIHASNVDLFSSPSGFDCGICLWSACGAKVVHNTIVSTGDNYSAIEWRFSGSILNEIHNNIVTHPIRDRDGIQAAQAGNLKSASLGLFVDGQTGELHLSPEATDAIDQGIALEPGLCDDDIDGDDRVGARDVGADEL